MAHKLTEQEQRAVITLAKALGKELPAQERGGAGGIASRLVRLRRARVTRDEVLEILGRYDAGEASLETLERMGVLTKTDEPGVFSFAAPTSDAQEPAGEPHAIAKAERPKPPARQDARRTAAHSLSHLDCVRKQTPELNGIRRQIIDLDPRLWINGWLLSTPEAFVRYEPELRALDAALAGSPTLGDGTLSMRELSYRVFGDEKFLALESDGRKLLHLMGISDVVHARPQVKLELLHHIPKHHRHLRLVVSENLDPWVNMRNALFFDGRKRLFGERVHGVVFGNGYLVDDPHKLPELIDAVGAEDVTVLYWGDLDRAGLSILSRLAAMADERFSVKPFVAAYRLMLKRAMRRFPDPLDNEATDQGRVTVEGLDLLEPHLKEAEAEYLRSVVEGALLIPQEILTAQDL